jgi:hypothetical protein
MLRRSRHPPVLGDGDPFAVPVMAVVSIGRAGGTAQGQSSAESGRSARPDPVVIGSSSLPRRWPVREGRAPRAMKAQGTRVCVAQGPGLARPGPPSDGGDVARGLVSPGFAAKHRRPRSGTLSDLPASQLSQAIAQAREFHRPRLDGIRKAAVRVAVLIRERCRLCVGPQRQLGEVDGRDLGEVGVEGGAELTSGIERHEETLPLVRSRQNRGASRNVQRRHRSVTAWIATRDEEALAQSSRRAVGRNALVARSAPALTRS